MTESGKILFVMASLIAAGCADEKPTTRPNGSVEGGVADASAEGVADAAVASCVEASINDDQTSGEVRFSYSGSWEVSEGAGKHEGDDHYSSKVDDSFTVHFRGASIKLYGARAAWHGIAAVSLDGGDAQDVDCYGAARADDLLLYESPSLEHGDHQLTVQVTGGKHADSTGTTVAVDRVEVCSLSEPPVDAGAADAAAIDGTNQPPRTTMFVQGRRLHDRCGEEVILRGINAGIAFPSHPTADNLPEVGKTGANAVRLTFRVQYNNSSPAQVDNALQKAVDNKMVPIPSLWDATGKWDQLGFCVDYWTTPEMVQVLKKHEAYTLLNLANEAGNGSVTEAQYRQGYTDAINKVRQAGLVLPIVIDAANWGRDEQYIIDNAQYLLAQDPEHNLLFSWHPWDTNQPASRYEKAFDDAIAKGICLIVGEFSSQGVNYNQPIDYSAIMQLAEQKQIGWLWWWWSSDDGHALTTDATYGNWVNVGEEVCISSPYSIANTAKRTYLFDQGTCK